MPTTDPGRRRLALVIGIPAFSADVRPPVPDLFFATQRTTELRQVLGSELNGYLCLTDDADQRLSGRDLGLRIRGVLEDEQADDVLIVHILTHGRPGSTKKLYALGADGEPSPDTSVSSWLEIVEEFGARRVLFLLDLCHAGDAARQEYLLKKMDGRNKAWVIAASLPDEKAFNGYFTQATASVLDEIQRRVRQVHPSYEHVPFGALVDWVRLAVYQLAENPRENALPQTATGTPIDGTYPDLPFFPNPAYRPDSLAGVRRWLDPLAGPFLDELDEFDHFMERAAGYGPLDQGDGDRAAPMGIFTGRKTVLTALAHWIEDSAPGNVRFVTGCPGAGKSAILGLLVCAAHDKLSQATQRLWSRVVDPPIARESRLVAIHARQRTVATMLTSIASQLRLDAPEGDWDAPGLIQAIRKLDEAPLVILDALDEATAPGEVVAALLLPLARETRLDGSAACRILVGSRELGGAEPIRQLAEATSGLVDLDRTPEEELREDLRSYAEKLLGNRLPYSDKLHKDARHAFAGTLALRLTEQREPADPLRWGEFLTACLYAHHFITAAEPVTDPEAAKLAVAEAPLDLPSVLEMDLEARRATSWLRPVLAALGYARGDGMPLSVIQDLAPLFTPDGARCAAEDVRDALDDARFYLRSAPDTDSSSLYRLFHAGLADYLRTHPVGQPEADARLAATSGPALLDRLRPMDWPTATPYVRRHAAEHAAAVGLLDTLLADPEFLVYADPAHLMPKLQDATSDPALLAAAVYRASAHRHRAETPDVRRGILAVDAARHGALDLAQRLVHPPGRPAAGWRPEWATGSQASAALHESLDGMAGGIGAVTCLTVNHRPLLLVGGTDGRIRSWDLLTGLPSGDTINGHSESVRALAHTTVADVPIVVSGDSQGTVIAWDASSGRRLGQAEQAHFGSVRSLACARLEQVAVAVSGGGDGTVQVWELPGCRSRPDLLPSLVGHVSDLDLAEIDGSPVVVTASQDSLLRVWDLRSGALRNELRGHQGGVSAVACGMLAGRPVAVSAGEDQSIRVWNLTDATGSRVATASRSPQRVVWDSAYSLAIIGGSDGTVQVIHLADGEQRETQLPRHDAPVHAVTCTEGGQGIRPTAVTGDDGGVLRVWDLAALGRARRTQPGHASWVTALAVTSVSGLPIAVSGSMDKSLRRWDLASGRSRGVPLTGHDGAVNAIACVSLNGAPIAVSGGTDRTLRCWDLDTGRPRGVPLTGHDGAVNAIACVSLNGAPIAVSGGTDRTLRCWDLDTGRLRGVPLTGHDGAVNAIACMWWDGKLLMVSCDDDSTVRVWELSRAPRLRHCLSGHTRWVYAAACAVVDQQPIAVTSDDAGTILIWNLRTGKRAGALPQAHLGPIYALACGQIGGRPVIVSGGQDGAVRIWDLARRRLLMTIPVCGPVAAVALSHDTELIIGAQSEIVTIALDRLPAD